MTYTIFATVGTTSFDDFVQSLCSLSFLTAMAHHQRINRLTRINRINRQCHTHCVGPVDPPSSPSSTSSTPKSPVTPVAVELIIQYGRGECPSRWIREANRQLCRKWGCQFSEDESETCNSDNPDEGSMVISIPTNDTSQSTGATSPIPSKKLQCNSLEEWKERSLGDDLTIGKNDQNDLRGGSNSCHMSIRWYRFQPSLVEDMQRANVILCHAGAGTLLEALHLSNDTSSQTASSQTSCSTLSSQSTPWKSPSKSNRKIINAVINSKLMNNHQSELAEELEKRRHILVTWDAQRDWTNENGANKFWEGVDAFEPVPFVGRSAKRAGRRADGKGENAVGARNGEGYIISGFQRIIDRVMGFCDEFDSLGEDGYKKSK